jgi:hypothetical protein
MIQISAQEWTLPGRRRVSAFLLAICLNLAIVPCTMALEVVEQGHDCCPPEVQLEAAECCELDDASVDVRFGKMEPRDTPDKDLLPAQSFFRAVNLAPIRHVASVDPPDPPDEFPPLYDLYCVYLK